MNQGMDPPHADEDTSRMSARDAALEARWYSRANYAQSGEYFQQNGAIVRELQTIAGLLRLLVENGPTKAPQKSVPPMGMPPMRSRAESTIQLQELATLSSPSEGDTMQSRALRAEIEAKVTPLLDEKRLREMQKADANDRLTYYGKMLGLVSVAMTIVGGSVAGIVYLITHVVIPLAVKP